MNNFRIISYSLFTCSILFQNIIICKLCKYFDPSLNCCNLWSRNISAGDYQHLFSFFDLDILGCWGWLGIGILDDCLRTPSFRIRIFLTHYSHSKLLRVRPCSAPLKYLVSCILYLCTQVANFYNSKTERTEDDRHYLLNPNCVTRQLVNWYFKTIWHYKITRKP